MFGIKLKYIIIRLHHFFLAGVDIYSNQLPEPGKGGENSAEKTGVKNSAFWRK